MNKKNIIETGAKTGVIEMIRSKFEKTAMEIWAKVYEATNQRNREDDMAHGISYERE